MPVQQYSKRSLRTTTMAAKGKIIIAAAQSIMEPQGSHSSEEQRIYERHYRMLLDSRIQMDNMDIPKAVYYEDFQLMDFTRQDVLDFDGSADYIPASYSRAQLATQNLIVPVLSGNPLHIDPLNQLDLHPKGAHDQLIEPDPPILEEDNLIDPNLHSSSIVIAEPALSLQAQLVEKDAELISLKRAHARFEEELLVFKRPHINQNYIYTDAFVRLDSEKDLTKQKVQLFLAQYETTSFTKDVWSLISREVKSLIEHELLVYGLNDQKEDFSLWETKHFLSKLDQLYRDKVDTTTSDRLALVKFEQLYEPNGVNKAVTIKLLDIIQKMPVSESSDLQIQKAIISRAWNVLSHSDKTKVRLQSRVAMCKTFSEFFTLWCTDRVETIKGIKKFEADGYTILPRIFILTKTQPSVDREPSSKDRNPKNKKENVDVKGSTKDKAKLNHGLPPCNHCGRNGIIKHTGKPHVTDNCNFQHHPDRNPDAHILWKDSVNGKTFAAMNPSHTFLPYDLLKDGSKKENTKSGNLFTFCDECTLMSSLQTKISKPTSDFLSMTITHVQGVKGKRVPIRKVIEVRALIDTGSLAGDFISLSILNTYDLMDFVVCDKSLRKVCSGLDNSCTTSLGTISLFVTFKKRVS